MQCVQGTSALPAPPKEAVLTIGNFDGLHRGHQTILEKVGARAQSLGGTSCLLTFDPPPARVVSRAKPVPQIGTLEDRQAIARALGVDVFIVEPFTRELAGYAPERFAQEIILERIAPRALFVGYDFAFGRSRAGDYAFLKGFFAPHGIPVYQVEAVRHTPDLIVSSSAIRRCVLAGDVGLAAELMGRPHFIKGVVEKGDQRGRTLGFPTANVAQETELLPEKGVYATWLQVGGRLLPGVTNVGERPTFGGGVVKVEVHALDFQGDLYGQSVSVWFLERLRGEQRFDGLGALKTQISQDVLAARSALAHRQPSPLVTALLT